MLEQNSRELRYYLKKAMQIAPFVFVCTLIIMTIFALDGCYRSIDLGQEDSVLEILAEVFVVRKDLRIIADDISKNPSVNEHNIRLYVYELPALYQADRGLRRLFKTYKVTVSEPCTQQIGALEGTKISDWMVPVRVNIKLGTEEVALGINVALGSSLNEALQATKTGLLDIKLQPLEQSEGLPSNKLSFTTLAKKLFYDRDATISFTTTHELPLIRTDFIYNSADLRAMFWGKFADGFWLSVAIYIIAIIRYVIHSPESRSSAIVLSTATIFAIFIIVAYLAL